VQQTLRFGVDSDRNRRDAGMNGKSFIIGALVVAVGVLGYLYWDSQQNTVVKLPGAEIKNN
jgi:predicted negative regulator of RcsB-dependent stress response